MGEVGEMTEIFQWKREGENGVIELSEQERIHIGE
jgi:hypothetical protein